MNGRWLHRFSLLTTFATLALVGAGGLVTSHGAGMAVPDWPNTYGYNMFFFPVSNWVGGIFYEHSHRLVAAFVGLLTSVLAMWLWAQGTRSKALYWGLSAMAVAFVLMGARQMPVYYGLAGLAPGVIVVSLCLAVRDGRLSPGEGAFPGSRALRWLGVAAFAAVVLQGVLGGLRVVWLKDQIGIFHAALAQLFFLLVCAIALLTSRWWREGWREETAESEIRNPRKSERPKPGVRSFPLKPWLPRMFSVTCGLILLQLVLGAAMRHQHAGLAIPDFPLAYGKLWPATDVASVARYNQQRMESTAMSPITSFQITLQMIHRLVALAILAGVASCAWAARRWAGPKSSLSRLASVWLGLICAQALLGAGTIWSQKAADIATAHVVVGALSLALGGMLNLIGYRATALVFASRVLPVFPGDASQNPSAETCQPPLPPATQPFGTI